MEHISKPDIWMNGQFVPWDEASIHPFCHGLQRGAVLFESLDCNETIHGKAAIFRLREHMVRFENSANIVGMQLDYDVESLMQAVIDTVEHSKMKSCIIRPLAFYSDPVMDVYPGDASLTVAIGLDEAHEPPESYRVTISRFSKISDTCMPVKAKVSGNYISPMISKSEAIRAGFNDAILLDKNGNVAEGTTSNIFIVENGRLFTAPEDAILLGITRDTIIEMARKLNIGIVMDTFDVNRLKHADEVILCSSGKELTPIIQIDEAVIGEGVPGKTALRLKSYYKEIIEGRVPEFEKWLTCV